MTLPYDPQHEEAIAIAPLVPDATLSPGGAYSQCDRCERDIWLTPQTLDFIQKHEVPAVCPDCAEKFAKGDI